MLSKIEITMPVNAKKEQAFNIARPVSNQYLKNKEFEALEALEDKSTKWIPTKSKRVKVGYAFTGGKTWLNIYVYIDNNFAGIVEFDIFAGQDYGKDLRPLFGAAKWYVPHVAFMPQYRGLGYASFIYSLILNKGIGLITEGHTIEANRMWHRIAERVRATLYYVDSKFQGFTEGKGRNDVLLMTKHLPKAIL